jgi:hypothetical protein
VREHEMRSSGSAAVFALGAKTAYRFLAMEW